MYNKFFGFLVAFLFVNLSVFAQDEIPKIEKEKLREDSINAIVDKSIDKIDRLVFRAKDYVDSAKWDSAYVTLRKSRLELEVIEDVERSYLCDDTKISSLESITWDSLSTELKINFKINEAAKISDKILSLENDLSLVNDSTSQSDKDDLNSELISNRIALNSAYESMFSDIDSLANHLDEAKIFEFENLREESWENIPLDNKIDAYISPLTSGVVGLVFTEITIRSYAPRVNQFLIDADFCESLNDADKLINDEKVKINGYVVDGSVRVKDSDLVIVDGNLVMDFITVKKSYDGSSSIQVPFVLIWLLIGSVLFTIYFGFVNITGFKHAIEVVRGKFDNPNKKEAGEVSHFQALTAALSGTVGVGNIAGVAIAVSIGGAGATFWMIVAGLFGMSAKFVECTLGTKYRRQNADGSVSGGPMYYLSNGLAKRGATMGMVGKVLAICFAIACIGGSFGGGCMVQINQATKQLISVTGGSESFLSGSAWMFGSAMAILVGMIIIGGIKSIAKVTDKVVPFMVGIYLLGAIVVLGGNIGAIPGAFSEIFSGAFNSSAMYGGIIGVLIQGFRRAAFSNEAGIGSASIAHSAAKTDEPVSEGMVSLLEPFIDTVVICTMTALVIIISGYGGDAYTAESAFGLANSGDLQAIELTSAAFQQTIPWFPIILSIAVILFALSTMISWSYYGLKAWTYIFGESKSADIAYKAIFCVMVVIGSAISASSVFNFGDAMIFAMCFPNILGLYFLAPEVKEDLKDYLRRVKSGEIKRFD